MSFDHTIVKITRVKQRHLSKMERPYFGLWGTQGLNKVLKKNIQS